MPVREFSVPATVTVPDDARLSDAVVANAREVPTKAGFGRRTPTGWADVTAADFAAEVAAIAAGLVASGIELGDRVGLM